MRSPSIPSLKPSLAAAVLFLVPALGAGLNDHCGALIRSVANPGLCAMAASATDAAPVTLASCPYGADLRFLWSFFDIGNASHEHFIRTISASGKRRMEVRGWSHDNGGLIQIWGPNLGTADGNQKWLLQARGGGATALVSVDSGKCLDAPLYANGVLHAGDQLQQYACNFGSNQLWTIQDVVTGCNPLNE